jgi:uncharacterized protein YndB with AHSA1/START domain
MDDITTSNEPDRIDRQIDIDAPAQRVWDLVSRPGWYVNLGSIVSNPVIRREGETDVVWHQQHGDFRLRTVSLEPPRYAAFRWIGEPKELCSEPSTLVQFWIEDRPGGGVTPRVAESGFSSLGRDTAEWLQEREGNDAGWRDELQAAQRYLADLSVERSVDIAAAPAEVWPLLTDGAGLARWYAFDDASGDLRSGGAIAMDWAEHGTFRGRVVEVLEPTTFSFRLSMVPDEEPADTKSTLVTFTLTESGPGCVLTVRQTGFEVLDPRLGTAQDLVVTEIEGWESGLRLPADLLAGAGV